MPTAAFLLAAVLTAPPVALEEVWTETVAARGFAPLTFSPDGSRLICAGAAVDGSPTLGVRNAADGSLVRSLRFDARPAGFAFVPGGGLSAAGRDVVRWTEDFEDTRVEGPPLPGPAVWASASADGAVTAFAGTVGEVSDDVSPPGYLQIRRAGADPVTVELDEAVDGLFVSADGRLVWTQKTLSETGVRAYDLAGRPVLGPTVGRVGGNAEPGVATGFGPLPASEGAVIALQFGPEPLGGPAVADRARAIGADGEVRWRVPADGQSGRLIAAAVSPDDRLLATSGGLSGLVPQYQLMVRSLPDMTELAVFRPLPFVKPPSYFRLAFSPDSRLLAAQTLDGRVTVYRVPGDSD